MKSLWGWILFYLVKVLDAINWCRCLLLKEQLQRNNSENVSITHRKKNSSWKLTLELLGFFFYEQIYLHCSSVYSWIQNTKKLNAKLKKERSFSFYFIFCCFTSYNASVHCLNRLLFLNNEIGAKSLFPRTQKIVNFFDRVRIGVQGKSGRWEFSGEITRTASLFIFFPRRSQTDGQTTRDS